MRNLKGKVLLIILILMIPVVLNAGGKSEQEEKEKLTATLEHYGDYLIAGDLESWGLLHAEDVIKMPPNSMPTVNRLDMVEASRKESEMGKVVSFDVDIKDIVINRNNAHMWGMYKVEVVPNGGGPSFFVDGKFLTICEKNGNGEWLITHDCYNSNVPLPAP